MNIINNIFFILGNPRSGTTLLRLMLNSHPNIVVPPESGFIQWWYNKYQSINWSHLNNDEFLNAIISDFLKSKKIENWNLDYDEIVNMVNLYKPKNYSQFCILFYVLYGIKRNKKKFIIGDKNNYYINHLELLDTLYPNAKYIHIIRDGRDVACSYLNVNKLNTQSKYKPKLPMDLESIANEWIQNIKKIEVFINNKDGISIRYEDLITNPENILRKISNFLKVEYSSKMLEYYNDKNYDEPVSTRDWKIKTKSKLDSLNYNKYKTQLTDKQINKFNKIAKQTLLEYGYQV